MKCKKFASIKITIHVPDRLGDLLSYVCQKNRFN